MLSFPNRHIVFLQKIHVALISLKVCFFAKRVCILVKEHRDYLVSPFHQPEASEPIDMQRPIWSSAPYVKDSMSIDRDYFSPPFSSIRGKQAR